MNPKIGQGRDPRFILFWSWIPLILFAALLGITLYGPFDRVVFSVINGVPRITGTWIWANVTVFGDALVLFAVMASWLRRRPEWIIACLIAFLIQTPVLHLLKSILDVPRPQAVLDAETLIRIGPRYMAHSFPSGHTATAFTVAGVAALCARRARTSVIAIVLAFLVGISRIAAGVHWPSDVAAGALLGWGSAAAGVRLAVKIPIAGSIWFGRIAGAILLAGLLYTATLYNPRMPLAEWTVKAAACAGIAAGAAPFIGKRLKSRQSRFEN